MKIDRHLYLVVSVVVLLFLLGLSVHDWLQSGLQFARKVQEDGIGVVLVGYVIYTLLCGSSNDEEDDEDEGRPSPRPVVMRPPPPPPPPAPRGSPLPSQPVNLYVIPAMPVNPRNPSNPSNPR